MGLRFSDAIKLSFTNVLRYKKRSMSVVITISTLFGVVMAFGFMLNGLKKTILQTALDSSGKKIYLDVGYSPVFLYGKHSKNIEINKKTDMQPMLRDFVSEHNGKIVGKKFIYQNIKPHTRIVLSFNEKVPFISHDFSDVPKDKIPIITPSTELDRTISSVAQEIKNECFEIGHYPTSKDISPKLPGFNPLNILLGRLYRYEMPIPFMVDDGSGTVDKYLAEKNSGNKILPYEESFIVVFNSYRDVNNFIKRIGDSSVNLIKYKDEFFSLKTTDIFTKTSSLESDFNNMQRTLMFFEIIFVVIAVFVAVFTSAHLIDGDISTIALYNSMGASAREIYAIFFLYLVELCTLSVIVSTVLAGVIVRIFFVLNSEAIAVKLKEFYFLNDMPNVSLFGFNRMFYWILSFIMLIAPITMILVIRKFSPKHIAKKLREE